MKVLLIEDEPVALRLLKKQLLTIRPSWEIMDSKYSAASSIKFLKTNKPDLIITDIHLSDSICFEIFNSSNYDGPVIFTTAYDRYAIKAFKLNSIDYLLKPIDQNELKQAIEKFELQQNAKNLSGLSELFTGEQIHKRLLSKIGNQIKIIEIPKIAYLFSENKISYAVDFENQRFPLDETLEEIHTLLPENTFFRINRQIIVNVKAVQKILPFSSSRLKLMLTIDCPFETVVSKERTPNFKNWLPTAG